MGRAIQSSLALAIGSLLVPYTLSITLSHVQSKVADMKREYCFKQSIRQHWNRCLSAKVKFERNGRCLFELDRNSRGSCAIGPSIQDYDCNYLHFRRNAPKCGLNFIFDAGFSVYPPRDDFVLQTRYHPNLTFREMPPDIDEKLAEQRIGRTLNVHI